MTLSQSLSEYPVRPAAGIPAGADGIDFLTGIIPYTQTGHEAQHHLRRPPRMYREDQYQRFVLTQDIFTRRITGMSSEFIRHRHRLCLTQSLGKPPGNPKRIACS